MTDANSSAPSAGERLFVRLGAPPDPSASNPLPAGVAPQTPTPSGIPCYEVEMRDGLLWIVSAGLDHKAVRERIAAAQRDGVPLFVVEGTVLCQGIDGGPVIEAESTEPLSSFTARHLRLEDRPDILDRHI